MKHIKRYSLVLLCLLGLVLIRAFESVLFYDPFITFFKNDYLYLDAPEFEPLKLIAFTTLRYVLNTVLSLSIIYVLFKELGMIKFAGVIYVLAYIVLIGLFLYLIHHAKQEHYYVLFNIRRFLIQPILLLLLLPAFYYQRLKKKVK